MIGRERADFLMGTVISQKAWGRHSEEAMDVVFQELNRWDHLLSCYKVDSDISKINRSAGIDAVSVDSDTFEVVSLGLKYGHLTQGRFDVTIAPLVKAWGILTDDERVPEELELKSLLDKVGYRSVVMNENAKTVKLPRKGQMLDLGGIAKGWMCDKALKIYASFGLDAAMINMGGNVAVYGTKPDRSLWRVGVQDPTGTSGAYVGILSLEQGSVVTSGAYQRYFEKGEKVYHHILDPRTGWPVETDLLSATLVAPQSSDAEGLSTPVFMAGLNECRELLSRVTGAEAVLVDRAGCIHISEGLLNRFELTEEAGKIYQVRIIQNL